MVAYRRPKNLGDTLIRAKLSSGPSDTGQKCAKTSSVVRCKTRNCKYCNALDKSGNITSSTTKHTYTAMKNVTCKSTNLIYCITCNTFMKRIYAHFYSIGKNGDTSVARHFSRSDHNGASDCALYILEFIQAKPDSK